MKRILILPSVLAVLTSWLFTAQTQVTAVPSIVLGKLNSPSVPDRAAAFRSLLNSPEVFKAAPVADLIVNLLQRENQLVRSTLLESQGRVGVSQKYGEGYSEYYSQLLDTAARIGNKEDPRVLEILARSSYNEDSPFAIKLSRDYGPRISPVILDLARSSFVYDKVQGVGMTGTILQYCDTLPPLLRGQLKAVLMAALVDEDVNGRGIRALAEVGEVRDIELIERVRQNDKGAVMPDKSRRYFAREAADRAIAKIKQRAKNGR